MFSLFANSTPPKSMPTTVCKFMCHPDDQSDMRHPDDQSDMRHPDDQSDMCHPDDQSDMRQGSRNFGIFRLSTEQTEPKIKDMHWLLNIDRSGSMNETCPDGKTKMQHIHHTLKNMVDYFLKLPSTIKQTLTIIGFDHEINIICEKIPIDAFLKTALPEIIPTLTLYSQNIINANIPTSHDLSIPQNLERLCGMKGIGKLCW